MGVDRSGDGGLFGGVVIVSGVENELIDNRYQLLDVIASGGMATVWRARDTRLNRVVALKRPHPAPADDPAILRIEREARIAASVSHPNLVTVFDSGRDETGPFMVMELVDGEPLQTAVADMGIGEVIAVAAQIADALAAIHEAGVVHRDVKPANVMMSDRGPLLTDFGIARMSGGEDRITVTGDVVATPSYAAPEVLSGSEPTPSADVYSFAIMVYELAGAPPAVRGSDPMTPPPALTDRHLERILRPALSHDPAARPTAGDLAAALRGSAPTQVLGAPALGGATAVMDAVPPLMPAPVENRPTKEGIRQSPVLLGMAGLALAALVAVAVLTNSGDADTVASPTTQPIGASTTLPPATNTPTTTPDTVPPTTVTTVGTTSTTAVDPVTESRDRFVTVLDNARPSDLKPKDKREMIDQVDDAISKALDGRRDNARKQLEDVAEKVESKLGDDLADQALRALADLADALDITPVESDD